MKSQYSIIHLQLTQARETVEILQTNPFSVPQVRKVSRDRKHLFEVGLVVKIFVRPKMVLIHSFPLNLVFLLIHGLIDLLPQNS